MNYYYYTSSLNEHKKYHSTYVKKENVLFITLKFNENINNATILLNLPKGTIIKKIITHKREQYCYMLNNAVLLENKYLLNSGSSIHLGGLFHKNKEYVIKLVLSCDYSSIVNYLSVFSPIALEYNRIKSLLKSIEENNTIMEKKLNETISDRYNVFVKYKKVLKLLEEKNNEIDSLKNKVLV